MTDTDHQRLLIIEDDPEIQHMLSVVLAADDREIVSVETAAEARAALAAQHIDLVVLDLILPDVDGRSLLSELRAARETAATPVVVMTARSGPDVRQDCYALGADAFIEKPFDPEKVTADIGVQLERQAAAERQALTDPLTGLENRAGLEAGCAELEAEYGLGVIQLDGFGERSERWGWDRSERIVREVAR
ncbi:MAG: response regulator, partial [Gemmatimonadota bacterium]